MKFPNGFGWITKLKGKRRKPYIIRKTNGWIYDKEKDKYKQDIIIVGYAKTKKEALEILTEYNKNCDSKNSYNTEFNRLTFKEVYENWSSKKFLTIAHSNINGYKAVYIICEELYNKEFRKLKFVDLQKVVDDCNKNYPTLIKLKTLFKQLYKYALKNDICEKDYAAHIDIVQYKNKNKNKQERERFTDDEIQEIWKKKDDKIYQTILMLIYSGCRISELLDLKKENVHLEEQYFDIMKSKTENGLRKVPIADKVLPFFEKWYHNYPECEYLLGTSKGRHFKYNTYLKDYYNYALEKLDIHHTPHCCRPTFILMLAFAKVDQTTIKKIVGHTGAMSLTEKVYTHFDIKPLLNAVNQI